MGLIVLFVLVIAIAFFLLLSELVKQSEEIDVLHITLDDASKEISRLKKELAEYRRLTTIPGRLRDHAQSGYDNGGSDPDANGGGGSKS